MTCGISLEKWREIGILERETALYRRLLDFFPEIVFVTYGGDEDVRIAEGMGFRALPKRSGRDAFRYSFSIPWVYRRELRRAAVLKTNQFDGSWAAVMARLFFRRPLVVRAGYMMSLVAERERWSRKGRWWARTVENWGCRLADRVMVTTDRMRRELAERARVHPAKIVVNPNYVDTDVFRPVEGERPVRGRIGYVGRLEREKNLEVLIRAAARLGDIEGVEVCIVGEGGLRDRLEEVAEESGARVRFLGSMPNRELPAFYRSCEVFVLCSDYEGHPKALIEAMACGTPVVGTAVEGIRDVIEDGETGILAAVSEESLAAGIRGVLEGPEKAAETARRGAEKAKKAYSLEAAVGREVEVYRGVIEGDIAR